MLSVPLHDYSCLSATLALNKNVRVVWCIYNEQHLSSRPVRDLKPWPLRYRCSALPTELTSQLGAGHNVGSYCVTAKIAFIFISWPSVPWYMIFMYSQSFSYHFTGILLNCVKRYVQYRLINVYLCVDLPYIFLNRSSHIWFSYIHSRKEIKWKEFSLQMMSTRICIKDLSILWQMFLQLSWHFLS